MSYASTILAEPSLVAYWKLDDAGANAADSKASYTCSDINSPTHGAGSLLGDGSGSAFSFAGGSSQYTHNSGVCTPLTGLTAASLECILSRSSAGDIIPIGFCGAGGGTHNFSLIWYSDGRIYCAVSGFGPNYPNAALAGTGKHHLLMVYDNAASPKVQLYIDGSPASLDTGGAGEPTSLSSAANLTDFQIGGDTSQGRYATGIIDEVSLYSAALDSAAVAAHYAAYIAAGGSAAQNLTLLGVGS